MGSQRGGTRGPSQPSASPAGEGAITVGAFERTLAQMQQAVAGQVLGTVEGRLAHVARMARHAGGARGASHRSDGAYNAAWG